MNNKFTVLIVDDIEQNLHSLELMIQDEFDVDTVLAKSAEEAISILMKTDINLILTDIQMPDIDGFEFTEYLKGIDRTSDIPVILITGIYDKAEYQQKGYDLGAVEYITKPIDNALLSSKLKVYITLFEHKREDKNALKQKDELIMYQSKMAAMGEMIGIIAHQLKQPLNVLSLYCQDVKTSFEYEEINREFIKDFDDNTKEQIRFLSKTIDDFRNFFNPNKVKKSFNIKETVEKIITLMEKQLIIDEINITLDIEENQVFGIQSELQQVILNLVGNAQDALLENQVNNKEIKIKSFKKDERIELSIQDNAGGIPQSIQDKIFNPYFTTKEKGTGVGLYMVKLVIDSSFNSRLQFDNTNEGAVFSMSLPLGERV